MGLFNLFFGAARREASLMEKRGRAVAIVESFTKPDDLDFDLSSRADAPANFGQVVFKYNRNNKWLRHKVILREDIGEIKEGDQWIVKFNEEYTRILAVHCPLSASSVYRIPEEDQE